MTDRSPEAERSGSQHRTNHDAVDLPSSEAGEQSAVVQSQGGEVDPSALPTIRRSRFGRKQAMRLLKRLKP